MQENYDNLVSIGLGKVQDKENLLIKRGREVESNRIQSGDLLQDLEKAEQGRAKWEQRKHPGRRWNKVPSCDGGKKEVDQTYVQKRFQKCRMGSSLNEHKINNTGENCHNCLHCEKTFYGQPQLIDHERIHTGETTGKTPYTCLVCGECFWQKSRLVVHESIQETDPIHVHCAGNALGGNQPLLDMREINPY